MSTGRTPRASEDPQDGLTTTLAVNGKPLAQAMTGTQRYAYELLRRLALARPGEIVLHVPRDAAVPDELAALVVVRRSRLGGQLFEQVALPWAARRELLLSLGGPAPLLARRQVVTLHDVSVFRHPETYSAVFARWYRLLYLVLAKRAEHVLTVSEFSRAELEAVLGLDPARVTVVPNGCDHVDAVTPVPPVLDAPALRAVPHGGAPTAFVLCVGTFARHKNLGPALDALEAVGLDSIVVGARGTARIFAGAGTERWTHATFAGRVSDEELVWLYDHAAALVFPSRYEGFGIPVVEAQRRGCPVVAVSAASLPEVAGDGAVLCDVAHPEAIAQAVRQLEGDAVARSQLVERGRANAAKFTWDASAKRLREVLDAVR